MRKIGISQFATGLIIVITFVCSPTHGDQGPALINAAKEGDLKQVQELLDQGAEVDAKNENGITALMEAYGNGHMEIMQLLLEWEADVDARDTRTGTTIWMAASTLGQIDIVKLLLNGVLNIKGNSGETALAQSSYVGWPEVAKLLLEAKADVNARTNNGATPLMLASLKTDVKSKIRQ